MHYIVTTLTMNVSDLVCCGPNCSPDTWLATTYPSKTWHLLRLEGNFNLHRRGSVVMTRHINEFIDRIRERRRHRIQRLIEEWFPRIPADCVAMMSSYLRAAARRRPVCSTASWWDSANA